MSKREKGLKSERRGKKQKPLMLGMHKGSLPPFPVGLPPPFTVINCVLGQPPCSSSM